MKGKISSMGRVAIALVLALSLCLMTAVPASAATGSVALDKDYYKASDTLTVTVVDGDLNDNPGVQQTYSVGIKSSTTEPVQSYSEDFTEPGTINTDYTVTLAHNLADTNADGQYTTADVSLTVVDGSLVSVSRARDGTTEVTLNSGATAGQTATITYDSYPELVVLTEDGVDSSTFTGTIVLADAAISVGDGTLQADGEGEIITVYYADSSVPAQRTDTATTDYTAPTYNSAITGDLTTGDSSAKNKIYLTFTEATAGLDAATVETTDFSVSNPARTVSDIAEVGTNHIILTLDSDLPTDATPDVTLVNNASVQDNAGNELAGTTSATYTTGDGTTALPTAITVTAPTNTADFTAALYDAAGTTELVAPIASTGDDLTTDTVVLSYSYAASTDYTVKVTAADEAGDYTLSDDGDPAGSGGPVSLASATLQHASDGLRPEVVSAVAEDTNDNGYLDKITLTMSEDLTSNNPTNTAFDVVDSASTALTEVSAAAGGATTTGTLSFTSSSDTVVVELSDNAGRTGVPTLTYTAGAATEVQDLASNVLATCTPTVTDAALPTVNTVSFIEGDNALEETLVVGFSEDIATVGATSDYEVLYDADGDFGTTGDQRTVTVNEVADGTGVEVELTIPDQSLQTDWGGKFKVTVVNPANVKDASENGINPANADATSGAVAFDTVAPEIIEFEAELGAKTATVKFSEGVYTNNDGTGALAVADDLAYTDVSADGVSAISDVSHIAGGEIAVVTLNAQATSTDIGSDTVAAKTVTAIYDKAGNVAGTATVAMADARDALSLVDSWNLVSIPKVASAGWDIASNAPDLVDIYIYDNGGWSSVSDANSLDAVFINANGPQELALSWTTDVQTAPPTKALEAGWNLVGANMDPPTETSVPVDQFLDSVSGSYSTVFSPGYNLISWTVVFSGSPGSQNVLSYEGYWLYMTAAGELAGRTT